MKSLILFILSIVLIIIILLFYDLTRINSYLYSSWCKSDINLKSYNYCETPYDKYIKKLISFKNKKKPKLFGVELGSKLNDKIFIEYSVWGNDIAIINPPLKNNEFKSYGVFIYPETKIINIILADNPRRLKCIETADALGKEINKIYSFNKPRIFLRENSSDYLLKFYSPYFTIKLECDDLSYMGLSSMNLTMSMSLSKIIRSDYEDLDLEKFNNKVDKSGL